MPDHEDDQRPAGSGTILQRLAALWQTLWKSPRLARPRKPRDGPPEAALPIGFQAPRAVDAWLLWTTQVVWPALRRLARTGLRDLSPLRRAVRTLPEEEKEAWHEAVDHVQRLRWTLQQNPRAEAVQVYVRLVKLLNESWFIPRRILLACVPPGRELRRPGDITPSVPLVVCYILDQLRFAFQDAEIPVHFVSMVFPPGSHFQKDEGLTKNFFDPTSEWAVIDLDFWKAEVLQQQWLSDETFGPHLLRIGKQPADFSLTVQMAEEMRRVFAGPFTMYQALVYRTCYEEVRHGIDSQRVLRGDPESILMGAYFPRVPEVLLSPGGRLRREVWEPAANGPPAGAGLGWFRAARTIEEVSGQLTAAAMGPAPKLLLCEWKQRTSRTLLALSQGMGPEDPKLAAPHEAAARIAIALLAEQLQLAPPAPLGAAARSDYERLHSLAVALSRRGSSELRLALKEIYRREFVYNQIDEPPFPGIGPKGEYIPRPLPGPSGSVDPG